MLHLFITDHRGESPPPSLTPARINQAFKRLTEFLIRSLDGYAERLEESSPVFELADLIAHEMKRLQAIRLYVFSDARVRDISLTDTTIGGVSVTHHVWDIERLYRLDTSGLGASR